MSCSCSANSDEGAWRSKTMMLSVLLCILPHYINIVRLVFQIEDRVKQVIHSFYVETLR